MSTLSNSSRDDNTPSAISNAALELLGHMRAALLTERERADLWSIAFGSGPITAVHLTTVEHIARKLEGRRAA